MQVREERGVGREREKRERERERCKHYSGLKLVACLYINTI